MMNALWAQLVVNFERDMNPRIYPALGQTALGGVLEVLTLGAACRRLVDFSPCYGTPEARIILDSLDSPDVSLTAAWNRLAGVDLKSRWFDANDGWKTAICIQGALNSPSAQNMGLELIEARMKSEVADLVEKLGLAVERDIRFNVHMEEGDGAPSDVRDFCEQELRDNAEIIREMFE